MALYRRLKKMKDNSKLSVKMLLPFALSVLVIVLDQVTKALIVKNIPPFTIGY